MKPLLYILCSFLMLSSAKAQDSSFLLVRSFRGDIADATMDNLDNLYLISTTGQVRKFNANGDSAGIYNQTRNYGKLYSIDVSNPLKPILFFKDFSTIVLLDRFLSNRGVLDLRKLNILQPGAVGLAYDNTIWVFDEYDNKLKKIDDQGNKLLETADFRTALNTTIRPQKIINDNGLVYLADTASGVFVFDNYGSFKKKIALKNWSSLLIKENYLIHTVGDEIVVYNSSTFTDKRKRIPGSFQPYIHAFSTPTKLVTFSGDSLRIYQYRF